MKTLVNFIAALVVLASLSFAISFGIDCGIRAAAQLLG